MEKQNDDDKNAGNEERVGESQSEDIALNKIESEFPDRKEINGERPGLTMARCPRILSTHRADTS